MIHRYRVQNFKSIIDVSVDLSPVTVLVGKSGTGKSNFVNSLRFLRDILSSPNEQLFHDLVQSWPQIQPAGKPEGPTRFEVEFAIAGIDERFKYELAFSKLGPQTPPLVERLDLGKKCLFHQENIENRQSGKWVVAPELLQIPAPGQISIGKIPSISEVVIAFTALTFGLGSYAFSDKVLSNADRVPATTGFDDTGSNYLDTLKDIVSNLQDLKVRSSMVGSLKKVNPSISSVELNDIRAPNYVVVGHRFNGKTISLQLSQESDGFRRFYAHLLALYQRPPKQTLIFEHPEDGIHPGALSLLADEFKSAPNDGRGQVLLTTHSPILLDHFDADQIRVVQLDGIETRIGPISTEQQEAIRDNLLDPGELLTVDPARLQMEATGT